MTTTVSGRLLLLVLVAAVAGCAGPPASSAPPPHVVSDSSAGVGVLEGHLYATGGPAPGRPRPLAGTVTITGVSGSQDVAVGPDGAYTVTVPPGRYTVAGRSPGYGRGNTPCHARDDAQVSAGQRTTADTQCPMR